MDGLQLLAEIKQRYPDLPVMMVTAYGDDGSQTQARQTRGVEEIRQLDGSIRTRPQSRW